MLVAGLIGYGMFRHSTQVEQVALCSERLDNGTVFGLQDRGGASVSATDLQARLGGRDWGVLENAKVVAVKDGPTQVALQVGLPKAPPPTPTGKQRSGMGFTWLLSKITTAKTACLTYAIWLPIDFEFGNGGGLPGLFGGEAMEIAGQAMKTVFSTRNAWGENGSVFLRAVTADDPAGLTLGVNTNGLRLERGRWLQFEQEVVLNDPGETNGVFRLWIDGKLHYDERGILFRTDDKTQFLGVVADVHYGANGSDFDAVPKSTAMRVTPFVVRWQ